MPRKLQVYVQTQHGDHRILVRLRDYNGQKGEEYFKSRSRRFAIYFEGRFKPRVNEEPYTADEVEFGAEFDRPPNISSSIISTGQKIISYIDPAIHYQVTSTGRCRFMSPFLVAMNVIGGWPCPSRAQNAQDGPSEAANMIPKKYIPAARQSEPSTDYSSFTGQKPANSAIEAPGSVEDEASPASEKGDVSQEHPKSDQEDGGTEMRRQSSASSHASGASQQSCASSVESSSAGSDYSLGSQNSKNVTKGKRLKAKLRDALHKTKENMHLNNSDDSEADSSEQPPLLDKLRIDSDDQSNGQSEPNSAEAVTPMPRDAFITPPETPMPQESSKEDRRQDSSSDAEKGSASDSLDDVLGPWSFGESDLELAEDNAFLFGGKKGLGTSKRRKMLSDKAKREKIQLDPDVVYAGSFHSNAFDFNTYKLHVGPINLNMESYLGDMPLGFALGTNRLVDDGKGGKIEEVFFRLVFELDK